MKLTQLAFRVSKIWNSPQGTSEKEKIDQEISYPADQGLDFASNFKADLMMIKLKEEISVLISNAQVDLNLTCQLCLEPFVQTIVIPEAEREFYHEAPKDIEDPGDVFLINTKALIIDLSEMVRQEIILHFPLIPVCSKSCKGLCMYCGVNKNKTKCECKDEEDVLTETHKPFGDLQKIIVAQKAEKKSKTVKKTPKKNSKK